jgi:ribosomal RNA-processing protein 7
MDIPSVISGFSVIPVSYKSSLTHYLYARSHSSSKSDSSKTLPDGRTLFLVNVPPDATERELVMFFKNSGTVEKVVFDFEVKEPHVDDSDSEDEGVEPTEEAQVDEQPKKRRKTQKDKAEVPIVIPLPSQSLRRLRKTGLSAHVVFLDSSSLDRALASTSKPRPWPTSSEEPSGISHYRALYDSLRPSLDSVKAYADSSIEYYEYELAKKKQISKYRKGEAIVDEDGFTLVTRGGAYGQTLGGGVNVASKRFQRYGETTRNRSSKKEKKEKEDFYAFHKAEKQRSGFFIILLHIDCLRFYSLAKPCRTDGVEEKVGRRQGKGGKTEGFETVQTILNHLFAFPCTSYDSMVYLILTTLKDIAKNIFDKPLENCHQSEYLPCK